MNITILLSTAFHSLAKHKTRSLLTTLGIIIGVVSIIAVMAIGQGAKTRVQKQIEGLGTNFIIVIGGQPKNIMRRAGSANETLKDSDLTAIMEECDLIYKASPGIQAQAHCIYENANWQALMGGINEDYLEIRKWPIEKGEFFTEQDIKSGSKVAVLGATVTKNLFDSIDPVDKIIRINKIPFKVIGVLSPKGKRPDGMDEDDVVFAPITTVQQKIRGVRKFAAILLSTKSKDTIQQAAQQISGILRQQHKLLPTDDDDFTIFTQDDIAQASEAASQVLNLLLIIIASISLIVGGIGIMNIMLVTVAERTKEIGIRMALGATTTTIRRQFIFEAITICLIGSMIGIMLGVSIAKTIGFFLQWPIFITTTSLLISLFSATLIGLFFGYYPAYQASQLNPVDALAER